MSILKELELRSTNMERESDFKRRIVHSFSAEETGRINEFTPDRNREWQLRLILGITFWANKAQFTEARKIAETALLQRLYSDVLQELAEIRHAVFDGDANSALDACTRMQKALGL